MATIALYAHKTNQMPSLLRAVGKAVSDYKAELIVLSAKTLAINSSVCNLDEVIASIKTSTKTQEKKITTLNTLAKKTEEFIVDVTRIDCAVADLINKRKDDFYARKPGNANGLWGRSFTIPSFQLAGAKGTQQ
jgi:hypothetical protein